MSQSKARKQSDQPLYRQMDPSKVVGGCDGYFEPSESTWGKPMRPTKTWQDRIPKEQRPRYQAWLKTQET